MKHDDKPFSAVTEERSSEPRNVFHVNDFGAKENDGQDDRAAIKKAFDAAIAAGPGSKVVFGQGPYHIAPESPSIGIWVFRYSGLNGLEIQGDGTQIIMTDPFVSFLSITGSKHVSITGFTFDYATPPFVQGTITKLDAANRTVDFAADEGYPLFDDSRLKAPNLSIYGWVVEKDRPTMVKKTLRNTNLKLESWSQLGGRSYQLKMVPYVKNQNLFEPGQMEAGDRFVIGMRQESKPLLYLNGSENVLVKDVTIYASPGGAINGAQSSGLQFVNLQVKIKPDSGRLRSTNADALHLRNNRQGAVVQDSVFEASGDDFINLYNSPYVVQEVMSSTKLLMTKSSAAPQIGDKLQLFEPIEGIVKGIAHITSLAVNDKTYEVTLDSPIEGLKAGPDYKTGDHVYNLNADSQGFVIKNNVFRDGRRHGVLVKAHHGMIEGNTFEHMYGSAIAVHNEPDWPEGPMATDLDIRNNTIRDSLQVGYIDNDHNAVIEVAGKKLGDGISATRGMKNITISGNRITDASLHGISVLSGEHINLSDNTIEWKSSTILGGIYERTPAGKVVRELTSNPVYIENSKDVAIERLTVEDDRPKVEAAVLLGTQIEELETNDIVFRMAPGATAVKQVSRSGK